MNDPQGAKMPIPAEIGLHTSLPHFAVLWGALAGLILSVGSFVIPTEGELLEKCLVLAAAASLPALFSFLTYRLGNRDSEQLEKVRHGDYEWYWELNEQQSSQLRQFLAAESRSRLYWRLLTPLLVGFLAVCLNYLHMLRIGVDPHYSLIHSLQLLMLLGSVGVAIFFLWWIITYSARRANRRLRLGVVFTKDAVLFGGVRVDVLFWNYRREFREVLVDDSPTLLVELERRFRSRQYRFKTRRRYEIPIPDGGRDDVAELARHYASLKN